jgi:uncharacterized protein (DUF1778 family)
MMVSRARLDLKLDPADKVFVSRAAALQGTTVADFVRQAVKEKAATVLDRESKVMVSTRDFEAMMSALQGGCQPNPALNKAIKATKGIKRA